MQKIFILTGSLTGALGVAIGAFGAHALKSTLETTGRLGTFETAVKYQFIHALALILTAILLDRYPGRFLHASGYLFLAGIILFSGSLFILSITGYGKWGAVAPFGGLALIAGWILLFLGVLKQ